MIAVSKAAELQLQECVFVCVWGQGLGYVLQCVTHTIVLVCELCPVTHPSPYCQMSNQIRAVRVSMRVFIMLRGRNNVTEKEDLHSIALSEAGLAHNTWESKSSPVTWKMSVDAKEGVEQIGALGGSLGDTRHQKHDSFSRLWWR